VRGECKRSSLLLRYKLIGEQMKVIAKHGFAYLGVVYDGGNTYENEDKIYNEIKSDVTIVETVVPTLEKAQNTAQKTVITKDQKTVRTVSTSDYRNKTKAKTK
jgi:hypothetical protein